MTREEARGIIAEHLDHWRRLNEQKICTAIEGAETIKAFEMAIEALEQELKYCTRDMCIKNEYNGIGCDECEVTKSQEQKIDAIPVSKFNLGDNVVYGADGNLYKITVSSGKECEQDPCDNCEYLDGDGCRLLFEQIEYGKASNDCPCEDAISRQAVLNLCDSKDPNYKIIHFKEDVECLPSVNPQPICEEREKGECPYYAG